jgi:hypothetical protein
MHLERKAMEKNNREIAKKMVRWFAAHKASYVWKEMEDAFTSILDESDKKESEKNT